MYRMIYGDATEPQAEGTKIIAHVCNNKGVWGAGFVLAVSNKWPRVKEMYQTWMKNMIDLGGKTQFALADSDIIVANMVAQDGVGGGGRLVNYNWLADCLESVAFRAKQHNHSVHMPMIGAGLGGGNWNIIEAIIRETLKDVDTTIYMWEGK